MSNNLSPFTHQYRGTPISLICTPVDNGQGYWNYVTVEVLFNGNTIGLITGVQGSDLFQPSSFAVKCLRSILALNAYGYDHM
jgi:hypothetical protein